MWLKYSDKFYKVCATMRDDFDNEWLKKNHRRNSLKIQ